MTAETEGLITVREAAQECGRNMETIRRWIWDGKLPAEKLGNQLFIKRGDFTSFCRETATLKYQAEAKPDFLEPAVAPPKRMKARGVKPINAAEEIGQMREERMNKLEQSLSEGLVLSGVEGETNMKAESRASLIKRMRKLREEIRARVGNLDAAGTIEQLREERMNELTRLR